MFSVEREVGTQNPELRTWDSFYEDFICGGDGADLV